MILKLYSDNPKDYLKCDDIIDYDDDAVKNRAGILYNEACAYLKNTTPFIKSAYEFVRDNIRHTADINAEQLAYPIRTDKGEKDGIIVYPNPDTFVVNTMRQYGSRTELWKHLPAELGYMS